MTQRVDRVIKGGLLVSGSGVARKDVLIKGSTIAAVEDDLRDAAGDVVDATGLYVFPGIIDAHSHPVNADRIDTMSVSAAYGGITTMVPFLPEDPNGEAETVVEAIQRFIEEARASSVLDFGVHAMLYPTHDPETDIPALTRMGVVSFKMFMSYARHGIMMPDDRLITCMKLAAEHGGTAMVHAENGQCLDHLIQDSIATGRTSPGHFGPAHPRIAEVEAVNRAATYAAVTGAPLYVVHISAGETLDALRRQGRGCDGVR